MRTGAATFLFSRRIRVMVLGSEQNSRSGAVEQKEKDARKWAMCRGWVSWVVAVSSAGFELMLRTSLRKEWESAHTTKPVFQRSSKSIEENRSGFSIVFELI